MLLAGPVLVASAGVWFELARRNRRQAAWVPFAPRSPVPWDAADLLLLLGLLLTLALGTRLVVGPTAADPPHAAQQPQRQEIIIVLAIQIVALSMAVVYLKSFRHATARDLGWNMSHCRADVVRGLAGFSSLAPPVFLLQFVLVQFWDSSHPLVEYLTRSEDWATYGWCFISAVIVAPLVEEFAFRVVLQGWLERVLYPAPPWTAIDDQIPTPLEHSLGVEQIDPKAADSAGPDAGPSRGRWPILASSLLFSLAHFNHGPDPIPLFLLALGLGYLYHRTHRLLPCVVMHASLNAFSLAYLGLDLLQRQKILE
jgi:membrane protease YdiL (CAAX protease family)